MSDQNLYAGPPNWFPTAIEKDFGWVHPATGEILVTMKTIDANPRRLEVVLPEGQAYLQDDEGAYVVDDSGNYLTSGE